MLGRERAVQACQAMRQHDLLAQGVAQGLRHLGTDDRLVQAVQRAVKGLALCQHQRLLLAVGKALVK